MTARPIIVIPADYPPMVGQSQHLQLLHELAEVRLYSDRPASDSEMRARLESAHVLLNSRSAVKVSRAVLQELPSLKMIAVCGIGYDAIDVPAATEQGVVVCNIPGRTATIVAEHAFGLMLSVSRRMALTTQQLKAGEWPAAPGVSLVGRTVGVIGTGNIGCEMLRFCKAFGMQTVAWSFHPDAEKAHDHGFQYVPLDQLLQVSDVVSVHVRLSAETHHLLDRQELQQMKPGSILINTARAAVVNTQALKDAIDAGHLFGAGIDVYDAEPLSADNPLLTCRNVVLTPHSADQTPEGLDLLTLGCVENIRAFLNGRPQHVVNPEVLHSPSA